MTTYVLDLLSLEDIQEVFRQGHAAIAEDGLFCHVGLTHGIGPVSKTTSALWAGIHRIRPGLVGGCRPLNVAELIPKDRWRVLHREVVVSASIASEVLVAQPR